MRLYFIALLPPEAVRQEATQIKQYCARVYQSAHALKSPPHVTLQPPFKWPDENLPRLEEVLRKFARQQVPIPMILSGFGAFVPRVIYIHVERTPELIAIHQAIARQLETNLGIVDRVGKTRPFSPHMTVAFRDLSKSNFRAAWQEFKDRPCSFEFVVPQLTLLQHDGKRWQIYREFFLGEELLDA